MQQPIQARTWWHTRQVTEEMIYPDWVNQPAGQSDLDLAKKRLTFMLRRAAIGVDSKGSLSALAKTVGVCHTTICIYIDRGHFSPKLAMKIEHAMGRQLCPSELLVNPLGKIQA